MPELDGSVAIVTGAAGGVGREVVRLLLDAGASVVAEDIDPSVAELETADGRVAALVGDVADASTARAAVAAATERFGRLDLLVNNAARFVTKPVVDTTDDDWDGVMRTNVRGVFVHCREALPLLAEGGGGAIVNLASISGTVGLTDQVAYSASKGAIVQMTRQLAVEWSPRGVRVNAVAPGAIDTQFLRNALAGVPDIDEVLAQIAAAHPLGRISQPDEIAEVVLFLASPRSRFVTGAILMADGGYSAQ
jgi:NAD(P)-dependent dehydrogenase (short-subunit alcohol dehydrogenase family)